MQASWFGTLKQELNFTKYLEVAKVNRKTTRVTAIASWL